METIKDRIIRLCDSRGIQIAQLEKELKFGNGTIAKWDTAKPRAKNLAAVAVYFGVPVESLKGEEMPRQKENPSTINSAEELEDAVRRQKYSYFLRLFDKATPDQQDEAIRILLQKSQNQ